MKHIRRVLYILLPIVLLVGVARVYLLLRPIPALMERAGLSLSCIRGICATDRFTDGLNYKDGYDYAVLQVDPDAFTPPEGWTHGTATLRQINTATSGHHFCSDFSNDPALPATFTDWVYIPHNDADDFAQRAWFAAMYDADSGILALYCGHDLWGF